MQKVTVSLKERSYEILIGKGASIGLSGILSRLGLSSYSPVVVSNPLVYKIYRNLLQDRLAAFKDVLFLSVPDSERSKSWHTISKLVRPVLDFSRDKSIFLITFGGGVVGDLGGFLAAIYKRGVPYVQIPTTLLAQVDSAIGGKVAVDLSNGKNLLGAFYQPRAVVSDIDFLSTLPEREIKNGLAEIIKYGILGKSKIFNILEESTADFVSWPAETWADIVLMCSCIKASIVEKDELDNKDIRIALNLGHTIGHAVETACGYKSVTHGEGVAFGILAESVISNLLGILSEVDLGRIIKIILKYKCLPAIKKGFCPKRVASFICYDKKAKLGISRFVLPKSIGETEVVSGVDAGVIAQSLEKAKSFVN
ncbi:MAG: 3-dehydroquinate synthase [Candidatus Omnitrophica bacterium]|nr:3-dehydroquinate synthase [Candidatus Omnitrophota bacterium]